MASSHPDSAAIAARLRAAGCVFAEDEAELILSAAATPANVEAMVGRRAAGEPLEHLVGEAQFCGLRIAVAPGVFVPRRRSELLVAIAAALTRPGAVVLDLCCGSGALGAAVVAGLGALDTAGLGAAGRGVELHAADLDPVAVRVARGNLAAAGGLVHEGDLFDALPRELRGRVDVLLANVPYVPTGELGMLPAEARDHEPAAALDGGPDGLDVLRRVTAEARDWLVPGGQVLIETSPGQAAAALAAFADGGLDARVERREDLRATVVIGAASRRPSE